MNELLFFSQIAVTILFSLSALRMGKEALLSWVALQGVLANFFVIKQMDLFGLTVTCSDVYIVGSVFGLNLLQEFFGKEASKQAIPATFLGMVFVVAMSLFHLGFDPSLVDRSHEAYVVILEWMPRLLIASISVFFTVQLFDVRFFQFLKNRLPNSSLAFRGFISMTISQALDTLLFSFLGLYGVVSDLVSVMAVSFLVKCFVILSITAFTQMARKFVRVNVPV